MADPALHAFLSWGSLYARWWRVEPTKAMPAGKGNPFILTVATATRWLVKRPLPERS